MTSHCRHQRSLGTYVDGELKGSQVRQLEAHLTGCGECRLELANLQNLHGLLRHGLRDPAVPTALWPGVRARIEAGRPPGLLTTWIRQIWEAGWERPRLSLAGAAFMAFLLLSVGYIMWSTPVGSPPGQPLVVGSGESEVVVETVEPEPGFRAMVLTTSERGLKVIWVVARGDL
ncbi:MAG: zf-HC2 domain-containing protein [Candidatus Methylomirabilales bacterium]